MATLAEIKSRVRDTANVDSNRIGETRLAELINDAVAEIASSNRLAFSEKTIAVTFADGVADYQPIDSAGPLEKPVLWTYSHPTYGNLREIKQATVEGMRTHVTNSLEIPDTFVYTVWGWANDIPILRVSPTPTETLVTSLDCRIRFNALVADTDFNDVTVSAYDACTYMTLLLAAPYLENDDRIETWDRMYGRAIKRIKSAHGAARYSGSARRSMREPG